MTTLTIPANELLEGDTIRDDAASKRYGRTLDLEATVVVTTAPSRMVSVYGTSHGIERQLSYGPDELVTVVRDTHGRCRPNTAPGGGVCFDPASRSECPTKAYYGPMRQATLEADLGNAGPWYTVTVHGSPVEGSTDDKAEAGKWLRRANREDAFDGEATITITDSPLAS